MQGQGEVSRYEALAASYDELTVDVGYRRRADYLERLFQKSAIPVRTVLDLPAAPHHGVPPGRAGI